MSAPSREVREVHELVGPRGGKTYVLVLECGDWMTTRSQPPKAIACIGCFVKAQRPEMDRHQLAGRDALMALLRELLAIGDGAVPGIVCSEEFCPCDEKLRELASRARSIAAIP